MASPMTVSQMAPPLQVGEQDPFSAPTGTGHHRFSHFDNQLFALGPATSPEQARRALEAHIAETERRIQDASKLGTTLVQQRKELGERLVEVEKQQTEGDITPELRQKLVEIEKEYNEVGRESERAFLPKSRVSSGELPGSSLSGDKMRSVSPSKFESQATNSPSKLSVPNSRRQRNQPSNRVHDIEFATEISTSLLSQVRHLQAVLADKEEALRALTLERSRLEIEAEGFNQRLRSLDESEHRYKDENWNLETQIHESIQAAKDAAAREQKLTQALNTLQAEKNSCQRELDEIKLNHAKLLEDHTAAVKHYDVELGSVKRNITMAENERGALLRKVEDLTGQNQELAKAVASQRGRLEERDQVRGLSEEDFETAPDDHTPEHSPPPSPVKGTPRHSMLESETLKSSLHHAHRMIQNLKANIHREKTEKLELKRMLQDARDDLDSARRGDPGSAVSKRTRKADSKEFKKPPRPGQLGQLRNSHSEAFVDDANWEEDDGQKSPTHAASVIAARNAMGSSPHPLRSSVSGSSDHFQSARENNENTENSEAFETANEGATETEDFQTGVEDISGSDELTETEGGSISGRKLTPIALLQPGNRKSHQSTASTSGDEYSYDDIKGSTLQHQPQRLRLRLNRGGNRLSRSRVTSEEPTTQQGSPASFANSSRGGTPQAGGQSLFAELGDMGGSDEDNDSVLGTPTRSRFNSRTTTPAQSRPGTAKTTPAPLGEAPPPVPKLPMVDSGMMTEVWEPEQPLPSTPLTAVPLLAGSALAGGAIVEASHLLNRTSAMEEKKPTYVSNDQQTSTDTEPERSMSDKYTLTEVEPKAQVSDAASQWHDHQFAEQTGLLSVQQEIDSRPVSTSTYSDMSSQYGPEFIEEKLAKFPEPPQSRTQTPMTALAGLGALAAPLTLSSIFSQHLEPVEAKEIDHPKAMLAVESIPSDLTQPISQFEIHSAPEPLAFSAIQSVNTEPVTPQTPKRAAIITQKEETDVNGEQIQPQTPKANFLGSVFGWNKNKDGPAPIIAEDETRQSPSNSPLMQTPESQRPLKEVSSNPHDRQKKFVIETTDESSQTALTAEQIDEILNNKTQEEASQNAYFPPRGVNIPAVLRVKKSQESIGSIGRARSKMPDPDYVNDTVLIKRPGSATSARSESMTSYHPPLPSDHKEVIAAAAQRSGSSGGMISTPNTGYFADRSSGLVSPRSGSSGGASGSMGPPPLPASAMRSNPSFRPRTPNLQQPLGSPVRGGTTPRPLHSSGTAEIQVRSSSRLAQTRSRASSVSSFASEVETRFNLRNGMGMPHGIDSNTDPRMINAITQTMIGEYLWKYTRKAGRGTMSENRHRRYFWVHPYTRTLYWSDRDPSSAGRAELRAKSVPIEAVRVVTDDNPMPPGLHRKSLVIITPGRSVKFTATTGQRHETWFNALSYLLLRTGEDALADTSTVADAALTQEDVDEFNPGFTSNRSTRQGPPSLSSYNSRTTRNESPGKPVRIAMHPTLSSTAGSRPQMGTFSRLSSYWKAPVGTQTHSASYSSKRSRHSVNGGSIYEASEVHDSAEDLREIIEKQDRESDKLENVRACCDGKHDVGHLHSIKGRHASGGPSTAPKAARSETAKSRTSLMRRTD